MLVTVSTFCEEMNFGSTIGWLRFEKNVTKLILDTNRLVSVSVFCEETNFGRNNGGRRFQEFVRKCFLGEKSDVDGFKNFVII